MIITMESESLLSSLVPLDDSSEICFLCNIIDERQDNSIFCKRSKHQAWCHQDCVVY